MSVDAKLPRRSQRLREILPSSVRAARLRQRLDSRALETDVASAALLARVGVFATTLLLELASALLGLPRGVMPFATCRRLYSALLPFTDAGLVSLEMSQTA